MRMRGFARWCSSNRTKCAKFPTKTKKENTNHSKESCCRRSNRAPRGFASVLRGLRIPIEKFDVDSSTLQPLRECLKIRAVVAVWNHHSGIQGLYCLYCLVR